MFGAGWEKAGGEMYLQNAKTVFTYRGIQCWTKRVNQKGPWLNTHHGYFRMTIPGVTSQHGLTALIEQHGGSASLPNGGRFSYLVLAGLRGEVIAGFDGMHEHNIKNPLSDEMAQAQIKAVVDFLLDSGIGTLAFIPA